MVYELYGKAHKVAKAMLGRFYVPQYRLVSVPDSELKHNLFPVIISDNSEFINECRISEGAVRGEDVFPLENIVKIGTYSRLKDSFNLKKKTVSMGVKHDEAINAWSKFIEASKIPEGYRNAGLSYAGYILEADSWCLPSWIWTNAAIVRMNCSYGDLVEARRIADILISMQKPEGGWIVRFDYDDQGAVPIWAPNDSAYVANNACVEMYLATKEQKYLDAAELCAQWIITTARSDGMVYVGYNMRKDKWQTKHNIVDVGFTAGLFSRLFQITGKKEYKSFLDRFVSKYIELFYISGKGFATSLDEKDHIMGGMFGRGQAWALEGLIPYYALTKDKKIDKIINSTVRTLLRNQMKDGGWPYNLTRKLMGVDCKATAIIGDSLLKWYKLHPDYTDCLSAAKRALLWCEKHTAISEACAGGIFAYCTEGAIVHNMYTSTAFTYSNAYAIELWEMLKEYEV